MSVYQTMSGHEIHLNEPKTGDVGHVLWPAARLCSEFMERKANKFKVKGKRWLELGAGCGLIGQVLVSQGAEVTVTDLESVNHNLKVNIRRNFPDAFAAGKIKVHPLDWVNFGTHQELFEGPYDGIVASDVLYLPDLFEALMNVIIQLASPTTVVLITGMKRGQHNEAFDMFQKHFTVKSLQESQYLDDDGEDNDGQSFMETWYLYKLTKKRSKRDLDKRKLDKSDHSPATPSHDDTHEAQVSADVNAAFAASAQAEPDVKGSALMPTAQATGSAEPPSQEKCQQDAKDEKYRRRKALQNQKRKNKSKR